MKILKKLWAGHWWCMPLIPAFGRWISVSSRTAWSPDWVPGWPPKLQEEILFQKSNKKEGEFVESTHSIAHLFVLIYDNVESISPGRCSLCKAQVHLQMSCYWNPFECWSLLQIWWYFVTIHRATSHFNQNPWFRPNIGISWKSWAWRQGPGYFRIWGFGGMGAPGS